MKFETKKHWARNHPKEHGACGVVARFRKPTLGGENGTYGVLRRTLDSIATLQQRGGSVQTDWGTDGDGAGVLTDIPRRLIRTDLARHGLNEQLAGSIACGVFFLLPGFEKETKAEIKTVLNDQGLEVVYDRPVPTNPKALGPAAREIEPEIVRFGILIKNKKDIQEKLFNAQVEIDRSFDKVHVVSLSADSIVYKVMGTGKTLQRYYPELRNSHYKTRLAIGHIRMSTNTSPDFRLAHPYGTMVHNGEINTIDRLIRRARALGIPLPEDPSDSMIVDRIIQYLIAKTGCSLATAYRMIFPLVDSEIDVLPEREKKIQSRLKVPFGNLGQGPAAIIAGKGDEALLACDAMALRPLWFGETEKEFYASSERGAVNFKSNEKSPRPLAGGELVLLDLKKNSELGYPKLLDRFEKDVKEIFPLQEEETKKSFYRFEFEKFDSAPQARINSDRLRALGFNSDDLDNLRTMAKTGKEPLGSVGYFPGPMPAVADREKKMLADYCLERVAVITNPALDSEREKNYFSLRVRFGNRGTFSRSKTGHGWEFSSPLLKSEQLESVLEQVKSHDMELKPICAGRKKDESQQQALKRIEKEAADAGDKYRVIYLHDREVLTDGRGLLDPLLLLGVLTRSLHENDLRAQTGIIFASRRLRNLHDIMLAYGMGAELICPLAVEEICCDLSKAGRGVEGAVEKGKLARERIENCFSALKQGMKKIISTMGIHEIEGYGRVFSSVGLSDPLADLLEIKNSLGGEKKGLTLQELEQIEKKREESLNGKEKSRDKSSAPWSRDIIKSLQEVASGQITYLEYEGKMKDFNRNNPSGLRHCLEVDEKGSEEAGRVDLSTGDQRAPLFFAAMSYGSQNVVAFTAYAEAAKKLNILSVNGEGGEPPHLRGQLGKSRSQQLASGRFGIDTDLVASCDQIEIKIGQGAKPGEGGMLRGVKVNPHVALTRHTPPFIDLISPSNNHDLYSIEDLIPTLINELRVVNPDIKVDVKVPAISGLAKEGHPDSITISGFEGGTGAARRHALKRVGYPLELALNDAHRALAEAGLRDRLELRVEGGMKTVEDILKMGVLGAGRVGFGTLCMMAIGCLYCGNCFTNRCPRGIASPFNSEEEAKANGVPAFQPRQLDTAVENLVTFFGGMIETLEDRLSELGVNRFEHLKGRYEFLSERTEPDQFDFSGLFAPINYYTPPGQDEVIRGRLQTSVSADQGQTLSEELQRREEGIERLRFVTTLETEDRAVGSGVSGVIARSRRNGENVEEKIKKTEIQPEDSCVPGNGLGAFNEEGVDIIISGGAQDGTAKSMSGGRVIILPGENSMGKYLDGSVGKSAAYGATGGLLIVAGGWADSRFGVRCSGADLIHLGELTAPLKDSEGLINSRANLKGFAFEYMTGGRGLVLGDPGTDMASGMTAGVVYVRLQPELGLDKAALERRISGSVRLQNLSPEDRGDICELLDLAIEAVSGELPEKAVRLKNLKKNWQNSFMKVISRTTPSRELEFFEDPMENLGSGKTSS
jgi:glutamate synthase (NADPH/NADH) large chain